LGCAFIAEASFDLEQTLHARRANDVADGKHVFVTGLARAGTTILMLQLHGTGRFRSLTYRDMPFVLAPNLWHSISHPTHRHEARRERAHGDGIEMNFDSPEALEEVFWRVFCGDEYILKDRLTTMQADGETLERFRRYVAVVLKNYEKQRYLSKNNNSILRLASIRQAFPKAAILVPFRDPVQHAFSLLCQHERFSRIHKEDRFSEHYMRWLVHHEFGKDHRPFVMPGDTLPTRNPGTIDYWLELWRNVHHHLLAVNAKGDLNIVFVGYEWLCRDPAAAWRALGRVLDVETAKDAPPPFRLSHSGSHDIADRCLLHQTRELYETLDRQSRLVLA